MNTPLTHPSPTPFRFTGETGEYFRIWIVNLLLTMITLGAYSAWAKVRKQRYFYGNTELDGSPFDYLADPLSILKGRLIALAIFVLYATVAYFFPMSEPLFGVALFLAVPWLVVRALRFNAANSMHRNLRFNFDGGYGDAITAFILWPIASALSLGLAVPYMVYCQKRFVIGHSGYGRSRFALDVKPALFYGVYVKAFGISVLAIVGLAAAMAFVIPSLVGLFEAILTADPAQPGVLHPTGVMDRLRTHRAVRHRRSPGLRLSAGRRHQPRMEPYEARPQPLPEHPKALVHGLALRLQRSGHRPVPRLPDALGADPHGTLSRRASRPHRARRPGGLRRGGSAGHERDRRRGQ